MLNIEEALEEAHDVLKVKVVEIVFFGREQCGCRTCRGTRNVSGQQVRSSRPNVRRALLSYIWQRNMKSKEYTNICCGHQVESS